MVVLVSGGDYRTVPLDMDDCFRFDLGAFIPAIDSDYAIVFIDNPNNPTGQLIHLSDIEQIVREAEKKDCVVIVDEAYGDFVDKGHSAIALINTFDNLMVTRSFSKGYGMGKTKVGYGVLSSRLAPYYDKVSWGIPGSVSDLGAKLATELLMDDGFISDCRKWVETEKENLTKGLEEKGYSIAETNPCCPIFVLGHKDPHVDLRQELLRRGILSVSGSHFRHLGKNYVRINLPERPSELLDRL